MRRPLPRAGSRRVGKKPAFRSRDGCFVMISRNVEANTSCAAGDGRVGGHRVGCSRVWRGERSCGHDAAAGRHGKTSGADRYRGRSRCHHRDDHLRRHATTGAGPADGLDPKCTPQPGAASEPLVVGPGNGLKNVFVYVKDGLGQRAYAAPTTPRPRWIRRAASTFRTSSARRSGQTIKDRQQRHGAAQRSRPAENNREFNFSQPAKVPAGGPRLQQS